LSCNCHYLIGAGSYQITAFSQPAEAGTEKLQLSQSLQQVRHDERLYQGFEICENKEMEIIFSCILNTFSDQGRQQ